MRIIRKNIIYPELSYKINGVLFKVKKQTNHYLNEKQYCDLIEKELKEANIVHEREKNIKTEGKYRNRVDFLVEDIILLEIKCKPFITKEDYYQTRRYLDILNKKLAILVNMRKYYLHPKRILNTNLNIDN